MQHLVDDQTYKKLKSDKMYFFFGVSFITNRFSYSQLYQGVTILILANNGKKYVWFYK